MLSTRVRLHSRVLVRAASGSSAHASPQAAGVKSRLTREEELKARQLAMAQMLQEKAMREVSESASSMRPAGISHVLDPAAADPVKRLAELRDSNRETASDGNEQGGPKGNFASAKSHFHHVCTPFVGVAVLRGRTLSFPRG